MIEFPFSLSIRSFVGFEKIVQILIEKGANVNGMNNDGSSALSFAADEGSVVNVFNCNKKPIFLIKYWNKRVQFDDAGHEAVVRLLVQNGAQVNTSNKHNDAALNLALNKGNLR